MNLNFFFEVLIGGLLSGVMYALVALGFVLIYKATETISFAQGELMMVGAFGALLLTKSLGLTYGFAVLTAVAALALIGLMLERLVIRPVLGQTALAIVLITLGLGYVARGLIAMLPDIGTETHTLQVPYAGKVLDVGGAVISYDHLMVIGTTILVSLFLYVMFRFSKVGIAMRATSQNQLAAHYMGIPVKRINSLVWSMAAALACLAGILLAPITFIHVNMGFIGLKALPAAVVGGFTSLPGAILGGIIIGLVEAFSGFYLPEGFKEVSAYVVMLLVLLLYPEGLLGERTRKKV
jgi:branched-chain amino acid transport system permease protein